LNAFPHHQLPVNTFTGNNSSHNFQVLDSCMQFCEACILQIYFK
jgi:hypothetical protein